MQLCPAASEYFSAERPTPVLAPKNATVFGEDMVVGLRPEDLKRLIRVISLEKLLDIESLLLESMFNGRGHDPSFVELA